MKKRIVRAALVALSMATALSPAQALVIGTADSTNNIPFGGNGAFYYYQQVYSAASFAVPTTISSITFYNTLGAAGQARSGTFSLYLSVINTSIANFDMTDGVTSPWLDGSFTKVFNDVAPEIVDGRLQFDLTTPFAYDPSQGQLLLTVGEFSLSNDGTVYLDTVHDNGLTNSRLYAFKSERNLGLVTGFNDVLSAAPVPEPASWALMIGGFALAGAALRTRRASLRFA